MSEETKNQKSAEDSNAVEVDTVVRRIFTSRKIFYIIFALIFLLLANIEYLGDFRLVGMVFILLAIIEGIIELNSSA